MVRAPSGARSLKGDCALVHLVAPPRSCIARRRPPPEKWDPDATTDYGSGDAVGLGDRMGVAGVVVDPAQDLHMGTVG